MPHLGTFRPEFEEVIVIFEISTFEFGKMQSFMLQKKKMERKMSYFSLFGLEFQKTIVIFEISTLRINKCEFLTIIVDFGIEFAFSKGPVSAFSEGSGPGPLYEVCCVKES